MSDNFQQLLKEIAAKTIDTRATQKTYFATRNKRELQLAQAEERALDELLDHFVRITKYPNYAPSGDYERLAVLAIEMRDNQKIAFRSLAGASIQRANRYEKYVDSQLEKMADRQPNNPVQYDLFGSQDG